ncbi:MAG: four helix bundle protein [Bacteroidetes bacterium]|nr:four helix bundle protein [Bacteroidota bacterium]
MEKSVIKSYKDLEIWKKSVSLATELYKVTSTFPGSELYGITNQIRRASCSVPANIAEGYGRERTKNYLQFLRMARGSIYELDTFLTIAFNLKYISKETQDQVFDKTEELSKMINGLIRKLNQSTS